jgi:Formamidopyrimidine-DNA glycosylase N-terminal domain
LVHLSSRNRISARQGAKNAKFGIVFPLRPLRLCGRYFELWLRLCRVAFSLSGGFFGESCPNFPDVEIFRRYLNAKALNQKIARVSVKNTTVTRNTSPQAIARHLKDRKLQSSRRHGKFLFGLLDQGGSVVFHFGMTGSLKYFKEKANEPKHTRVRFEFSNSAFLGFVCPRMFGQVDYTSDTIQYIKERYSRCAGGYSERIQRAVSG